MCNLNDKTILAIDDTAAIRTFLRISLMDKGVNFFEAATAQQGLDICGLEEPDVVVLDLGLPDRDGLDILPELKQQHSGKAPVIIILTVRSEPAVKRHAYELGADAYLTKPFEIEDLVETLENTLH